MPAHFEPLAQAFAFLSASRAIGFGAIGCIPLVEIVTYHAIFPIGYPQSDFVELIRLIDCEYVRLINARHGPDKNTRRHH